MPEDLEHQLHAADRLLKEQSAREAEFYAVAPGRVNLIGDHTDYSDGLALPMAVDLYTVAAASREPERSKTPTLRVVSATQGETHIPVADTPDKAGDWSDYLRGVVAGYQQRGAQIPGMTMVIAGNLPLGAGLSSSAALELCMASLIETVCDMPLPTAERALLCQQAEHDYAGMPCGILDQFAVSFAVQGTAMILDCRDQSVSSIPVPSDVALAVVDSGVRHVLVDGGYAQRREEVGRAEAQLGSALRDACSDSVARIADPVLRARARHVVTENQRVQAFAAALTRGDLKDAGEQMYASHASLADDFAVSCPEIDQLVELARQAGAGGARMTGGGFGGSVICLVAQSQMADFEQQFTADCARTIGKTPALRWVSPAAGARAWSHP